MKFRRALLALIASALAGIVIIQVGRCIFNGQSIFEIELDPKFFAVWAILDSVPILCWLAVLVPLLFRTQLFDRWPWYWSGLLGFLVGAAGAIPLKVLSLFLGSYLWKSVAVIIWGLIVAVQFAVVGLTKRWARAAVSASVETEGTGQS